MNDSFLQTMEDFISIAKEVGDLDFLQFVSSFCHIPMVYSPIYECMTQELYKKVYQNLLACNPNRDMLTEYYILCGDTDAAANELLKNPTVESLLMAHLCLSPSKEATSRIASEIDVKQRPRLIATMFALSGDRDTAVSILNGCGETKDALRFSKFLFDDDEIKQFYRAFVSSKLRTPEIIDILAFAGDSHAILSLLSSRGMVSKGIAYLTFINRDKVKESELSEHLELQSLQDAIDNITTKFENAIRPIMAENVKDSPESILL